MLERGRRLREEESRLVHHQQHWEQLVSMENYSQEERDQLAETFNSIYINEWSVECGLLAAGAVLSCVDSVAGGEARAALAVVRPPGHHAEPESPHGFCFFNNVAIAAQYSLTNLGMSRVLILDWDVHHGNGIQHIFYNDSRVLYISLHRYDHGTFFPQNDDANYDKVGEREGEGFNINIPFNGRKMGDSEYFQAFHDVVLPVGYEFNPDLVLVSAGFDAAEGDPLGEYKVSPAMYGHMTRQLSQLAGGRMVVALEGGYNLSAISECSLMCAKALLGDALPPIHPGKAKKSAIDTIIKVVEEHRRFWKCLTEEEEVTEEEYVTKMPDLMQDDNEEAEVSKLVDDLVPEGELVKEDHETNLSESSLPYFGNENDSERDEALQLPITNQGTEEKKLNSLIVLESVSDDDSIFSDISSDEGEIIRSPRNSLIEETSEISSDEEEESTEAPRNTQLEEISSNSNCGDGSLGIYSDISSDVETILERVVSPVPEHIDKTKVVPPLSLKQLRMKKLLSSSKRRKGGSDENKKNDEVSEDSSDSESKPTRGKREEKKERKKQKENQPDGGNKRDRSESSQQPTKKRKCSENPPVCPVVTPESHSIQPEPPIKVTEPSCEESVSNPPPGSDE